MPGNHAHWTAPGYLGTYLGSVGGELPPLKCQQHQRPAQFPSQPRQIPYQPVHSPQPSSPLLSDQPTRLTEYSLKVLPSHHHPQSYATQKNYCAASSQLIRPEFQTRLLPSLQARTLSFIACTPLSLSRQRACFLSSHVAALRRSNSPTPANRATRPPPPILMAP
ncbi:hypothetical protein LY78DRAFT_118076 [Colletotrichum sublineola]|nr:hypothetical protein LY78DRAFT_118076 [Colletotrichum sublineola]